MKHENKSKQFQQISEKKIQFQLFHHETLLATKVQIK